LFQLLKGVQLNSMKSFIKTLLKVAMMAALSVFVVFATAVLLLSVVAQSFKKAPVKIPDETYLVFNLQTDIPDSPVDVPFGERLRGALDGEWYEPLHLRALIQTIELAARDPRVRGIYLEGSGLVGNLQASYTNTTALRRALAAFAATGKPVIGWFDTASFKDYYLMSVATELFMEPVGSLHLGGLAVERIYLADAFRKWGIGVQTAVAGDYKSAIETFTRSSMSEQDREQINLFLDDLWQALQAELLQEEGLEAESLVELLKSPHWLDGQNALEYGVIDALSGRSQVLQKLAGEIGWGDYAKHPNWLYLEDYAANMLPNSNNTSPEGDTVAVVYVEGDIVDGEGEWTQAGSGRIARLLREARNEEAVKAVVLRINSPGGTVTASEMILEEARLIRQAGKPLIVSFGAMAASGGYWVATAADTILTEPTCLTGSIGVWGMMLNIKDLADNIGIAFEREETHPGTAFFSPTRPLSERQLEVFQNRISQYYQAFLNRVEASRTLNAPVDQVAGGHIWSGLRAVELGLADDYGNLQQAISLAAEKAALGEDYGVLEMPQGSFFETFMDSFMQAGIPSVAGQKPNPVQGMLKKWEILAGSLDQPVRYYARLPFLILPQ